MNRRNFAIASTMSLLAVAIPACSQQSPSGASASTPRPPALPAELVKEFVVAAHGNLEKTKSMPAAEPGLVNATWDWGGGDFEQAIGGAGHMGRKDIAEFLIAQGARMDMFVAAMLGDLALVKEFLKAHPAQARAKGPHGISLVSHAEAGVKNGVKGAEAVLTFLKAVQ